MARTRRAALAAAVLAAVAAATALSGAASGSTPAPVTSAVTTDPQPVYGGNFADPTVVWNGSSFTAVATGGLGPLMTAPHANGPWTYQHAALTRLPTWSSGGGIWAPQLQHVNGSTWVMYFAAKVTGLVDGNQRCIGVAVSTNGASARYTPVDSRPLVCPPGSNHPGASAPVTGGVGLIDPATVTSKSGLHILLFKSQKPNPGTRLWSVELNSNWTAPVSTSTVLVKRAEGQIENPYLVVHGGSYYLFASWNNWADCTYRTVWLKNDLPRRGWSFPSGFPGTTSANGGTLIKSGRGLCGPGGMVAVRVGTHWDHFLHAYRDSDHNGVRDSSTRRLYTGQLVWDSTGHPKIKSFYQPAG